MPSHVLAQDRLGAQCKAQFLEDDRDIFGTAAEPALILSDESANDAKVRQAFPKFRQVIGRGICSAIAGLDIAVLRQIAAQAVGQDLMVLGQAEIHDGYLPNRSFAMMFR
jgi:hypothetical protein